MNSAYGTFQHKNRKTSRVKLKIIEIFIGVALGTGYLTSLRFSDYIGISEMLFFISILLLSSMYIKNVFLFKKKYESFVRIYLLSVFIILAPLVTIITSQLTEYNNSPQYLVSYSIEILFLFLFVNAIKNNISMRSVVFWFLLTFVVTNLISIYIIQLGIEGARYRGGANNPNQLLFYSSSLTLLLIIYQPKMFIIAFPVITFIMLKTGSDAYILSVLMVPFMYLFLKAVSFRRVHWGINVFLVFFVGIFFLFFLVATFSDELAFYWLAADNGNVRVRLMTNAFFATLESPLFGWGTGSFSGISAPFHGWEAHNTFLDLSTQFGFIPPFIFYFLMFAFLVKQYTDRSYLIAAFIVSYLIAGLFHNYSRHFIFWVEIAIFYHSFFEQKHIKFKRAL